MVALISNLQSFNKTIKYAHARVEHKATAYYKGFVTLMLTELASHTPQYTGSLAASWQVVVGKNGRPIPDHAVRDMIDEDWHHRVDAKWIGDPIAVELALQENEEAINSIRWNSHVIIVNTHPGLTGSEGDPIDPFALREGNFVSREDFMAVSYVASRYSHQNGRGLQIIPRM